MTQLTDLIVRNEDRLLAQVLSHAETNGYFRFVPGTPEEWRAALRGLSGSLLQAFRSDPSLPSLTADDIVMKSPGGGIPPYELDTVLGLVTTKALH